MRALAATLHAVARSVAQGHRHTGMLIIPFEERRASMNIDFQYKGPKGEGMDLSIRYKGMAGEDATAVASMCAQVGTAIESTVPTAQGAEKRYDLSLKWKGEAGQDGSAEKKGLRYSQALALEGLALDGLKRLLDMGTMEVLQGERT